MRSVKEVDVSGRIVFLRVDFNVPMKDGRILDDSRIRAALPTVRLLLNNGAKVVLATHLGRPKGREREFSTRQLLPALEKLLRRKVMFCTFSKRRSGIAGSREDVFLLENLRFDPGEEANSPEFSARLAGLADLYVNEAFSNSHRKHASMVGIPRLIPGYAGLNLLNEVRTITSFLGSPKHPFVAILGGSKVSSKIGVLNALCRRADRILIGGAMMFTFLASKHPVGKSFVERSEVSYAQGLLRKYPDKIVLPIDTIAAKDLSSRSRRCKVSEIPDDFAGYDIGPDTVSLFSRHIRKAKQVFWNGPLGVYEIRRFSGGTLRVAASLGKGKEVVIGGGDIAAAVRKLHLDSCFLSTGGGASLELVSGKRLPALSVLVR